MNTKEMPFSKRFMFHVNYGIAAALAKVGVETTKVMKDALRNASPHPAVFSGELVDSITFGMLPVPPITGFSADASAPGNPARKPLGPQHKEEHVIKAVTKKYELHVGTADPKGKYINWGTKAHKTNTDSAQFIANIEEWCADKGFDEEFALDLIKRIRKFGTAARPFLPPAKEYAESVIKMYVDTSVRRSLRSMPKVIKVIDKTGVSFDSRFKVT